MGVYQEGIIKTSINDESLFLITKGVSAHVFEYTTQIYLDQDKTLKGEIIN